MLARLPAVTGFYCRNFEIEERCKRLLCVDIGESFPTSIFLQNLVSIHLKTSPETSKFDFRVTQRFNFPMVFSPSWSFSASKKLVGELGLEEGELRPAWWEAFDVTEESLNTVPSPYLDFDRIPFFQAQLPQRPSPGRNRTRRFQRSRTPEFNRKGPSLVAFFCAFYYA